MALLSYPLEKTFYIGPKVKAPFPIAPNSRRKAKFAIAVGPSLALGSSYAIAYGLAHEKILCMLPNCKEVALSVRPTAYWVSAAILFVAGCGGFSFAIYWAKYLKRNPRT